MPKPNLGKVVFSESDVTGPAGLTPNDAYDLTLYEDGTDSKKGIIVVSMTLQMMFNDGVSKSGKDLKWDHASQKQFLQDYSKSISSVWNDKWRIVTEQTTAAIRETRVFFKVNTVVRDWYLGEHWELEITKTDQFRGSWVNPFFGTSDHDSGDVIPSRKKGAGNKPGCSGSKNVCAVTQRGAVHEFGHMLGLRDEYPDAKSNLSWKTDGSSVMHSGEAVRPRHYSIFADWLTGQYKPVSRLAGEKIQWKVDGKWDLKNSKL